MLVRDVIGHDVDQDPEPGGVCHRDQLVVVLDGAELGVHVHVVGDVVAPVGAGGGIVRRQPQGVDAEAGKVWNAGGDAGQIADTVAVAVGERRDVDLVGDGVAPPR